MTLCVVQVRSGLVTTTVYKTNLRRRGEEAKRERSPAVKRTVALSIRSYWSDTRRARRCEIIRGFSKQNYVEVYAETLARWSCTINHCKICIEDKTSYFFFFFIGFYSANFISNILDNNVEVNVCNLWRNLNAYNKTPIKKKLFEKPIISSDLNKKVNRTRPFWIGFQLQEKYLCK